MPIALAVLALGQVVVRQPSPAEPWGQPAVRRFAAMEAAQHRSVPELLRYYGSGIVLDACCDAGTTAVGRWDVERWLVFRFGPTLDEATLGAVYLDVGGAVVEEHLGETPARAAAGDGLLVLDVGRDGLVADARYPLSLPDLEVDARWDEDVQEARRLVTAYLRAWSAGDPRAVTGLYAPGVDLIDSLERVDLRGRGAVAGHLTERAGRGSPAGLAVDASTGGPAVYLYWPVGYVTRRHEFQAFVAYTADDGSGCPGRAMAALEVASGRIHSERRYHEVESVRRCRDTSELPDGWWTELAPVESPVDEITGTVEFAGQSIDVHNGTPALEGLVGWSMARFATAGLAPPAVASVAFDEDAHPVECAADHTGLTVDAGDSARVFVCVTEEEACADDRCRTVIASTQLLVLHELAHAWMYRQVGEQTREAFLRHWGLDAWTDPGLLWHRRGEEVAAQVIGWGLMDAPIAPTPLRDRTCAELAEAFELLTGAPPLQPCA